MIQAFQQFIQENIMLILQAGTFAFAVYFFIWVQFNREAVE